MGKLKSKPDNSTKEMEAICHVDLDRYLGKWYEIARLPHGFERGLDYVTATYSWKKNGKIKVVNTGIRNGRRSVAKATAYPSDKNCTGRLLVSFFWPMKSQYNIIKLDEENYQYAIVTSSTKNYLWFLCRKPEVSDDLYSDFLSFAASKGFDTSKIIKVKHNGN